MKFVKIPDEKYFPVEALSQSGVKKILKSPADFKAGTKVTDAMTEGKLIHAMVLEPEAVEEYFRVFRGDRRTKAGKDEYAQLANYFCVVPESMFDEARAVADAMLKHDFGGRTIAEFLAEPGTLKEVAVFWEQEFTLEGTKFTVPCKAKYDAVNLRHRVILDLKSCADASPNKFRNDCYNESGGHYLQSAFYRLPEIAHDLSFYFLACEKKPPFCTGLYKIDDHVLEEAYQKIASAAWIYKKGMETGRWSSQYNESPEELIPPGWFWMKQS